jgi:hypothetical protein
MTAADVSRQLVYQQFGDRDTLLLEAALDLATTELVRRVTGDETLGDLGSHLAHRLPRLDPPLTRDLVVDRDLRVPMPDGWICSPTAGRPAPATGRCRPR